MYYPHKFIAKNTVISPHFLTWKFCGKAQFPHSFHNRKLGEITALSKYSTAFFLNPVDTERKLNV